jgi:uncharacterized protein (DUF1015 family)
VPLVSPFVGLLFDQQRVGPLELVTAPPYDVVGPDQGRRLHATSPHNVVRLILGRDEPGDDDVKNKYTRAASTLRGWQDEGVLARTPGPAWYPYRMRFQFQGRERTVRGLICQVALEAWGGSIVPHEQTFPAPFEDRLALLRAVRANLSPVYALCRGPCQPLRDLLTDVERRPPTAEVIDEDGVDHLLWAIDGHDEDIPAWLRDEELLIADGHHRYSVALAFRQEMRARSGPGPWDHMMMLLVDATVEDPPVLPIHRVLLEGSPPLDGTAVRDLAEVLATLQDDQLTYGIAARDDSDIIHRVGRLRGDPPTVHALHEQVLGDSRLRFAADAAVAEELVRTGDGVAAFFLPPTRVDRIRTVIERGERLPQKSTYFWPKPRTGLVMRPME